MPFDLQPTLTGELIQLRPLRADDFDALFRVASDPLIWEQHPERNRYQETTFRAFFADALASGGALVAVDRTTGDVIGSSRFHRYDPRGKVVEIGWTFLSRGYWGGQYNGEMKRLMLEHAFEWVDRVIFVIGPENRRSQRAVEKIGAVRAGLITDPQGRARVRYEITPALFAARKGSAGVSLRRAIGWPVELDALRAAPAHHRLLLENERVRVLETRIAPGDRTPVHTHEWPAAYHVISWSAFVRRDDKGLVLLDTRAAGVAAAAGAVLWSEPLAPHSVENVGNELLHILSVEIKSPTNGANEA